VYAAQNYTTILAYVAFGRSRYLLRYRKLPVCHITSLCTNPAGFLSQAIRRVELGNTNRWTAQLALDGLCFGSGGNGRVSQSSSTPASAMLKWRQQMDGDVLSFIGYYPSPHPWAAAVV